MHLCPDTGLTVPECSCTRCIRRQFERFAPSHLALGVVHDPLLISEVRPRTRISPPVSERLTRPAL